MRVLDIRERSVPISRYADSSIPGGGLTTSIVAVTVSDGGRRPVVGFGFSSFGRYSQSGLIAERFAPRLLACEEDLDPLRAWSIMMQGEKPGGHGERCVAVGTIDMALWDAAAKIAGLPLFRFLSTTLGEPASDPRTLQCYASGGYRYPADDAHRLTEELRALRDRGYVRAKIKIGNAPTGEDRRRIEAALSVFDAQSLAVDAMNAYDRAGSLFAANAFAEYALWWFEDICDPLDFETLAEVAKTYPHPLAAGEALFSVSEAELLHRHGGLRSEKDVLVFDPVHCYGIPGYLRIVQCMERNGWPRTAFWPHGGHLFTQHIAAALRLGGVEVNTYAFAPFGADDARIGDEPGIGFEKQSDLNTLFRSLL